MYFPVSRNRASLPATTCLENEEGTLVKRMSGKNFPETFRKSKFQYFYFYCYNYNYYFVNREFQYIYKFTLMASYFRNLEATKKKIRF